MDGRIFALCGLSPIDAVVSMSGRNAQLRPAFIENEAKGSGQVAIFRRRAARCAEPARQPTVI
jgi:hypothetical protein